MCIRQRIGGSNPPLTAIFEMRARTKLRAFFFYILRWGGMRTPDRGSTTGAASWTDRERSKRAAPQGRAKRVNPPLTAIFEMRARTKVRAFFASDPGKPSRGRHKCLARATHPAGRTTSSPSRRSAAGKATDPPPVARPGAAPPGKPQAAPPVARPGAAPPGKPQAAPPVARPGAAPPGKPQAAPPVARPGAAPPGKRAWANPLPSVDTLR